MLKPAAFRLRAVLKALESLGRHRKNLLHNARIHFFFVQVSDLASVAAVLSLTFLLLRLTLHLPLVFALVRVVVVIGIITTSSRSSRKLLACVLLAVLTVSEEQEEEGELGLLKELVLRFLAVFVHGVAHRLEI